MKYLLLFLFCFNCYSSEQLIIGKTTEEEVIKKFPSIVLSRMEVQKSYRLCKPFGIEKNLIIYNHEDFAVYNHEDFAVYINNKTGIVCNVRGNK